MFDLDQQSVKFKSSTLLNVANTDEVDGLIKNDVFKNVDQKHLETKDAHFEGIDIEKIVGYCEK